MTLGDYCDYKGGTYRITRFVNQTCLFFDPETHEHYLLEERFYELKNLQTGRLEFVTEESRTADYHGQTQTGESTAYQLPRSQTKGVTDVALRAPGTPAASGAA